METQEVTHIARSLRNQQQSPLMRLPAELRNKIYEYALGDLRIDLSHGYLVHFICQSTTTLPDCGRWKKRRNVLALTKVSRQIYFETRGLIWTMNEFSSDLQYCLSGLNYILDDNQANAITTIRIETHWCDLGKHQSYTIRTVVRILRRLRSLKRLVVEWAYFPEHFRMDSAKKEFMEDLLDAVEQHSGGSIEVQVEKSALYPWEHSEDYCTLPCGTINEVVSSRKGQDYLHQKHSSRGS